MKVSLLLHCSLSNDCATVFQCLACINNLNRYQLRGMRCSTFCFYPLSTLEYIIRATRSRSASVAMSIQMDLYSFSLTGSLWSEDAAAEDADATKHWDWSILLSFWWSVYCYIDIKERRVRIWVLQTNVHNGISIRWELEQYCDFVSLSLRGTSYFVSVNMCLSLRLLVPHKTALICQSLTRRKSLRNSPETNLNITTEFTITFDLATSS